MRTFDADRLADPIDHGPAGWARDRENGRCADQSKREDERAPTPRLRDGLACGERRKHDLSRAVPRSLGSGHLHP